ncbi:MAG: TetR/AcrR family transcriptional regulator [Pseudomonadota bacterium]
MRIVEAMLALIAEGEITPTAELVAGRAEVGLRTVFRHFRDMDSLYAEMSERMRALYADWDAPFSAADWRGQLDEACARRTETFERLMPFKRAADAHRHLSPSLQKRHAELLAAMRARLQGVLPAKLAGDAVIFEAIDLTLSFEAWQRLRIDQGRSPNAARAILRQLLDRLTA